nr:MAG TPA: hypothetical protein [Caudoviricetes sp.]
MYKLTLNQGVQGSNPWWSTKITRTVVRVFLLTPFLSGYPLTSF